MVGGCNTVHIFLVKAWTAENFLLHSCSVHRCSRIILVSRSIIPFCRKLKIYCTVKISVVDQDPHGSALILII
jgi:hypothetical protein